MRPRVLLAVSGGIALAVASYAVLSPQGLPALWKLKADEKAITVHEGIDVEQIRESIEADPEFVSQLQSQLKRIAGG